MSDVLPTLSECLARGRGQPMRPPEQLQALSLWLHHREASLTIGTAPAEKRVSAVVHAYDETFSCSLRGEGFETCWRAIVAVVRMCETFERHAFGPLAPGGEVV